MGNQNINNILKKMRRSTATSFKDKGDLGEEAALQLLMQRKADIGNSLLYQSYKYPYQVSRVTGKCYTGNIFYENKKITDASRENLEDEIDILYITPYRIFAIEVKSYHANNIEVYEHWVNKDKTPMPKAPTMQAEKHCRHLYHAIYDMLPDGKSAYIQPIVCFVDRCRVKDSRSKESIDYIPVCVLDNLLGTISKYNTPLEYSLSLPDIERKLRDVMSSVKRVL